MTGNKPWPLPWLVAAQHLVAGEAGGQAAALFPARCSHLRGPLLSYQRPTALISSLPHAAPVPYKPGLPPCLPCAPSLSPMQARWLLC